jgi:hypothetical protein
MNDENRIPKLLYGAIGLVAVLLIVGLYLHYRSNRLIRRARELQQALRTELPPEERDQKRRQLRDTFQAMTPKQRDQAMGDGRKRFEERMANYPKMSREEKNRLLDEQIDRMERFRNNPPPNSNFGNRPQPNRSSEERERRRREMLDRSTPEFRAAMDQFRKDLAARRQQRGLPPRGRQV